ncbi:membrane protein [Cellvibrio zantedeschiae]|uniref:Membrane protein n=1 Tax=Cellvibrio zantedeschiae TaxID=1237077 RepID=A0ABQ3AMK3_9GAMM|nr:AI-2E family transporter [Cellvibrio zantedeschiae]GGY62079.1 membrane protein [Cellvibrio zantedeschiae]
MINNKITYPEIASYILIAGALLVILTYGLLVALFAGLLVHSLVLILSPSLDLGVGKGRARMVSVSVIGTFIITALTLAVWGAISFFQSEAGSTHALLQKMADIVEASRAQCPVWICSHLPDNTEELREFIANWMREHSQYAQSISTHAGHTLVRILLGMIIGAMISLHMVNQLPSAPLAAALLDRIKTLSRAFKKVVFAQVRISAVNTFFTGLYVLVVLPLLDIHLPMAKSLVVITFVAGLLPIVGNLISNTILVIVALPFGIPVAASSLVFLIVLHKLEYFLNAKIIGTQIQAKAWELLIAMLVMESIFGIAGVVAAPIFYAYLKQELINRHLI